jgi:isocitrate lyase
VNILYKNNGQERYPDFKLYKMIARNVHAHTPQAQLSYPLFSKFSMKKSQKNENELFVDLDKLPAYV